MSKLSKIYQIFKKQDEDTVYMFKLGIFYIFLDTDAIKIGNLLNLKITQLNNEIVKCGFPVSAYDKYSNLLKLNNVKFNVIDNINDVTDNTNFKKFLSKIRKVDVNHLSVSEAYKFIEDIKEESMKIYMGDL